MQLLQYCHKPVAVMMVSHVIQELSMQPEERQKGKKWETVGWIVSLSEERINLVFFKLLSLNIHFVYNDLKNLKVIY